MTPGQKNVSTLSGFNERKTALIGFHSHLPIITFEFDSVGATQTRLSKRDREVATYDGRAEEAPLLV